MDPVSRIGLLDAEPEFGRDLDEEARQHARRVQLLVFKLDGEVDIDGLLRTREAFAALLLDGVVLHAIRVAEQPTLRLLGPGDLLGALQRQSPMLDGSDSHAVPETRVALLDDRVLAAGQRWPRLFAALYRKSAEQSERVALQLSICQLPRVTDRLLALMWLLAESWGRVTTSGVTLPLALTHDTLGAMIGARRPTVTLAIGELCDRGAIIKQDHGWLLLERIAISSAARSQPDPPTLFDVSATPWAAPNLRADEPHWSHAELLESVSRLRSQHQKNREQVSRRLAEARRTRDRISQRRAELRIRRSPEAPSS